MEFKVKRLKGETSIDLPIPEDVGFFTNPDDLYTKKFKGATHYVTIVKTSKNKSWLRKLEEEYGVIMYKFGKHTIVVIENVCNDCSVKALTPEEWFSKYDVKMDKCVVGYADVNLYTNEPLEEYMFRKIVKFNGLDDVVCNTCISKNGSTSLTKSTLGIDDVLASFSWNESNDVILFHSGLDGKRTWRNFLKKVKTEFRL